MVEVATGERRGITWLLIHLLTHIYRAVTHLHLFSRFAVAALGIRRESTRQPLMRQGRADAGLRSDFRNVSCAAVADTSPRLPLSVVRLLNDFVDHRLCREHERCDRSCILQSSASYLGSDYAHRHQVLISF